MKNKKANPVSRGLYAWNAIHAGSFLLFIEETKDCYRFMFLPGPNDYYLTKEDFCSCCSAGLLEFVEALPDDVFEESLKTLTCP